jgi:hypothetical protein
MTQIIPKTPGVSLGQLRSGLSALGNQPPPEWWLKEFSDSSAALESRAMGSATNAGGGAVSGGADCGRDEDGKFGGGNKCQTVYHGTNADNPEGLDFNEVSKGKNSFGLFGDVDVTRHGIFFSDNKDFAKEYGKNVGEFSLHAKNTADLTPLPGRYHPGVVQEFVESLRESGKDRDVMVTVYHSNPNKPWLLFDDSVGKTFSSWLKSKGYDSAKFPEYIESDDGSEKAGTTFVVFDKNKVRPKKSSRNFAPASDARHASLLAFAEARGFCPTGEGNGIDNSCGSGTGVAEVDNSWKKSSDREYSYTPGEGDSPIAGGDDIRSLNIEMPKDVASAMKEMKIKSLTDVVAIGGGLARGSFTSIATGTEGVVVYSSVPVDPDNDESSGMYSRTVLSVDSDGKKFVDYKLMSANSDAGTADLKGEEAARTSSLLLEKFPESLEAAERAGFSYAKTFAMGDPESEFHGYRLWPKFGFDGVIDEYTRKSIPKSVIPHDDPVTIQQLISTPAGDKWWSENGSSMKMTLNFKDKKSDGYKRYQKTLALAKRLKKRNEGRSLFEILFPEYRGFCPTGDGGGIDARYASLLAFAQARDCGRDEGGKFSSGNTCASGVAADAAKGALKGAAEGAVTGLYFGGPAGVKPGAAAGAAVGAVKGIYDNRMRPTRVKRAIEKLGLDEEKVGRLVEKLGGSPRSSANAKRGTLSLAIRDKDGKKTFHVDITSKSVTVYPTRKGSELDAKEIKGVKAMAESVSPRPVSVEVKESSSAYVAKLVKNGFQVTAGKVAGTLVANYVYPTAVATAVTGLEKIRPGLGVAAYDATLGAVAAGVTALVRVGKKKE